MRFFYLLLFIGIINPLYSQFARIQSKDGFVNLREQATGQSEVIDQLHENDIFWCEEGEARGDWYPVDVIRNGKKMSGFVHKSSVLFINTYKAVPVKKRETNKTTFQGDLISVEMKRKPFIKTEHTIQYDTLHYMRDIVESIDNKEFWGKYQDVPTNEYEFISLVINNQKINIPKDAYSNVYDPDMEYSEVYYDNGSKILYIISSSSIDINGGYVVVWIIKGNKYERRVILDPYSY